MFEKPRYIQNSFNIAFSSQPAIRRKANAFEDKLKGRYFQPQIIPVPDELDPEVPRIIFGSEHGYSQIIISQVSFVLNVVYSPDWQTDISKGKVYLNERVSVLFDLLSVLEGTSPYFCGLSTKVRIPGRADDAAVLKHLAKVLFKKEGIQNVHDLQYKQTTVEAGSFFSNITISNYRTWNVEGGQRILSLPTKAAAERGVEIVGDYNDRYKFNEDQNYRTTPHNAGKIIAEGYREIEKALTLIGGVSG